MRQSRITRMDVEKEMKNLIYRTILILMLNILSVFLLYVEENNQYFVMFASYTQALIIIINVFTLRWRDSNILSKKRKGEIDTFVIIQFITWVSVLMLRWQEGSNYFLAIVIVIQVLGGTFSLLLAWNIGLFFNSENGSLLCKEVDEKYEYSSYDDIYKILNLKYLLVIGLSFIISGLQSVLNARTIILVSFSILVILSVRSILKLSKYFLKAFKMYVVLTFVSNFILLVSLVIFKDRMGSNEFIILSILSIIPDFYLKSTLIKK